ncbi:MAG: TOBE domain-containing protein [Halolamina sp.]
MDGAAAVRLEAEEVALDAADVALLRAIGATGSVSGAADRLGRSRARALSRLDELAAAFGPLVDRNRGGAGGGGSRLTERARDLLSRFARLRAAVSDTAGTAEWVVAGDVAAADGELLTVATPVGELRAVAARALTDRGAEPGTAVQVAVRADAVTLQATVSAPEPDATSARNQLAGTVSRIDRGDAVATAAVTVENVEGNDTAESVAPLAALLTLDSVARLGLNPGQAVVASFKATATRAVPDAIVD